MVESLGSDPPGFESREGGLRRAHASRDHRLADAHRPPAIGQRPYEPAGLQGRFDQLIEEVLGSAFGRSTLRSPSPSIASSISG